MTSRYVVDPVSHNTQINFSFPSPRLTLNNSADFNNVYCYEEYLRGYRIIRTYFAQFL